MGVGVCGGRGGFSERECERDRDDGDDGQDGERALGTVVVGDDTKHGLEQAPRR